MGEEKKPTPVILRAYFLERFNANDLFSFTDINSAIYEHVISSGSAENRLQSIIEQPYNYVISSIEKINDCYFGSLFTLDSMDRYKFISSDVLKKSSFSVDDVSNEEVDPATPSYHNHFYFFIKDKTLILSSNKFKVTESHFNYLLLRSGAGITVNVFKRISPLSGVKFSNIEKIIISEKNTPTPQGKGFFATLFSHIGTDFKFTSHHERVAKSIRKSVLSCEIYHPDLDADKNPENEIELGDILRLIDDEYGDVKIITKDGQTISSDEVEEMKKVFIPNSDGKLCERSLLGEMSKYENYIRGIKE